MASRLEGLNPRSSCIDHGSVHPLRKCIFRVIAENRSLNRYSIMHMKNDDDGYPRNIPYQFRSRVPRPRAPTSAELGTVEPKVCSGT
jgi:hypothetical protein